MKRFAALYVEIDSTTSTLRKVSAMARYFAQAPAADAAWAAYFLAGGKPRRFVAVRVLRELACRLAGVPDWLFEESYQAVGDLGETIALLLPAPELGDDAGLAEWMDERLLPLREAAPDRIEQVLSEAWRRLAPAERFVLNKLLTGSFRVGVSRQLVIRALAQAFELDEKQVAQRFVGYTDGARMPDANAFSLLVRAEPASGDAGGAGAGGEGEGAGVGARRSGGRGGHPYPFFLAHPLQQPPDALGDPGDWLVEWKWDGIRAQLVKREGASWIWSRGEELITDRFPELAEPLQGLPDGTVLDGELLCWDAGAQRPLPFAVLQRRIGRLRLTPKLLREAPVSMLVYDLLELEGEDLRGRPQAERRARLEALLSGDAAQAAVAPAPTAVLGLSPLVAAADWAELARLREGARERGVEGLMLKRRDAAYGIGRTKSTALGDWWKWKIDPLTADCVLVYAQRGHGRRASLYTDYTFAVWDSPRGTEGRSLVPFAKAYSGLTDAEIRQVDAAIRRTTVERFGPVRSVAPSMVFELGFEGIQRSPRHRSGLAVRFPRMLRMRPDKPVEEADTLQTLEALLASVTPESPTSSS
jgi:DNA ligase-1